MREIFFPITCHRVVSISACAQTHPASIALRYVQRRILMADPNWNNGWYYNNTFPRMGMQHARLALSGDVFCTEHPNLKAYIIAALNTQI